MVVNRRTGSVERNEELPDLLARLEQLKSKPNSPAPSITVRLLRKIWICAYFVVMFGPLGLWLYLTETIHASGNQGVLSAALAVPVLVVAVGIFLFAWRRLGMKVHSFALVRYPSAWKRHVAVGRVGFLSAWCAVFMRSIAFEVWSNPVQRTYTYRVIEVDECQFKCGFCRLRVSLEGAPWISGSVCAEGVRPRPSAGGSRCRGDGLCLKVA